MKIRIGMICLFLGLPGVVISVLAGAGLSESSIDWLNPDWASLRLSSLKKPEWRQTAAPGDGGTSWYLRIHPCDDRILVQSCDMGGNYMTWDASASYSSINDADWTFPRISYISAADFCRAVPQIGYLGTESNGIFKTVDCGKTWVPVSTVTLESKFNQRYPRVPISALSVNPGDPDEVWAGIGYPRRYEYRGGGKRRLPQGLIHSSDGGSTWTHFDAIFPKDEMALAILFFKGFPDTLIVGTDGGIYRSDDGGRKFRSISAGLPLPAYFGGFDGVIDLKTGQIVVTAALEAEYHIDEEGKVTSTGGVWLYNGGSDQWTEITGNLRIPRALIDQLPDCKSGMAPNPSWTAGRKILWRKFLEQPDARHLYDSELFDCNRSADAFFKMWDAHRKEPNVRRYSEPARKTMTTVLPDFHTVRIDPRDVNVIYVSIFQAQLPYGLWKTTDGGKHWIQTVRGAQGWENPAWQDYLPANEPVYNLRQSWTARQPMNLGTPKVTMGFWEIRRFDLSKSNPDVLYFHSHRITYRSENGGSTWTDASNEIIDEKTAQFAGLGNSNMCMYGLQFHPKAPERVLIWMADSGIKVSDDGGKTIFALPETMFGSNQYVMGAAFDPDDPNRFYAAFHCNDWLVGGLKGQYFFESRDFGKSFIGLSNPEIGAVKLPPKQPMFSADIGALLVDSASPVEARRFLASHAGTNRHTLYTGYGYFKSEPSLGIIESTDGGKTWHESNVGFGENREVVDLYSPDGLKTVYAAVAMTKAVKSSGGVYRSEDGGRSWRKISTPIDSVCQILTVGNRLYIAGGVRPATPLPENTGGIFYSDNAGASWTKILGAPLVNNLAVNPLNRKMIYCTIEDGQNGRKIPGIGVYRSTNGGKTWARINRGLAFPWGAIRFVWHPAKHELWLGTFGCGFYKLDEE